MERRNYLNLTLLQTKR